MEDMDFGIGMGEVMEYHNGVAIGVKLVPDIRLNSAVYRRGLPSLVLRAHAPEEDCNGLHPHTLANIAVMEMHLN